MKPPRHLWAGSWREESERARQNDAQAAPTVVLPPVEPIRPPAPAAGRPEPEPAPGPEPDGPLAALRRLPARRVALFAVPAVALVVGAYALGSRDNANPSSTVAPAALPASTGKPLKPRPGQTRAGAIYNQASPAVVSIKAGNASGTGFLVTDKRTVVTNAHVVQSAQRVTVRFGSDGRDLQGEVLGTDPSSDLAVIQLDRGAAPAGVKPLKLADSDQVRVGDSVIAIGNPFGLDRTATEGIVSGLGRAIRAPDGYEIDDVIQTDAPINPGNSGGPLLDETGRVIGVNSQIETGGTSNGNLGIGFAVSSNSVRAVVPQLALGRRVAHAWLGVATSGLTSSGGGAQVQSVTPGGPADRAGIEVGDTITTIDGNAVNEFSDVARVVNVKKPGDRIAARLLRGGRNLELNVTLGTRPPRTP
jgi:putative serine protease PepD